MTATKETETTETEEVYVCAEPGCESTETEVWNTYCGHRASDDGESFCDTHMPRCYCRDCGE